MRMAEIWKNKKNKNKITDFMLLASDFHPFNFNKTKLNHLICEFIL